MKCTRSCSDRVIAGSLISSLEHIFFPVTCNGCGSGVANRTRPLCGLCLASLPFTHFAPCPNNPVEKTFRGRIRFRAAASLLYFTKDSLTQHLVHQFKYKGSRELARYLGQLTGMSLRSSGRFANIDAVVPLPLHRRKEEDRGYNQAALIGEGIAHSLQVPLLPHALARDKATRTQTLQSREERWANVNGRFRINEDGLTGHILLVDDVITTGATLDACGSLINTIPGSALSIATLAFAMK